MTESEGLIVSSILQPVSVLLFHSFFLMWCIPCIYIFMYIYSLCLKICDCSTYLEQFNLYVCIRDLVRMHVTVSRAILHVICDVSAIFPRLLARVCQQCACHSHLAYHFLLSFLVSFVEFDRWLHYHEHFRMWSSFHPIPTTTPQKKKEGINERLVPISWPSLLLWI